MDAILACNAGLRLGTAYNQATPTISLSTTTAIRVAAVLAGAGPAVLSSLAVGEEIDRPMAVS